MSLSALHHLATKYTQDATVPTLMALHTTLEPSPWRMSPIKGLPPIDPRPERSIRQLTRLCRAKPHLVRGIFAAASHALPSRIVGASLLLPLEDTTMLYTATTTAEHYTHQRTAQALTTYSATTIHTTHLDGTEKTTNTAAEHHTSQYHPHLQALSQALAALHPLPDATALN